MTPSSSWQNILQQIVRVPAERRRLATALGVSEITLSRWTTGGMFPNRFQITRLAQIVLPQYRQELIEALEADSYPNIQLWLREGPSEQISPEFYAHVLNLRTNTTESQRFWQISQAILTQVLEQLDPNQLGMSITLVQCMPPSRIYEQKIRSLREVAGKGTPPWDTDLTHLSLFLGMESLAGYVVAARHEATIEDLSNDHLVPAYRTAYEVSAAAYPIMLGDSIIGCLSASSTQVGYFTQQRVALLGAFSNLTSLAFNKKDFYPASQIELKLMPTPEVQRPILDSFRQRVAKNLSDTRLQRIHKTNSEAEREAWETIENELIAASYAKV